MAELHGKRLAVDDGGRPVVDDKGQLVYVDTTAEEVEELEPGQAVVIDPATFTGTLDSENTYPQAAADVAMVDGDDPSAFTVPVVVAHLETSSEAEVQRVMDAEEAGKARTGILGWSA